MTSNTVINLNKLRAASNAEKPERRVMLFHYYAPNSEAGEVEQRPLVKIEKGSLTKLPGGDWSFRAINLYRAGESSSRGIRTYRVSRINGIVNRV